MFKHLLSIIAVAFVALTFVPSASAIISFSFDNENATGTFLSTAITDCSLGDRIDYALVRGTPPFSVLNQNEDWVAQGDLQIIIEYAGDDIFMAALSPILTTFDVSYIESPYYVGSLTEGEYYVLGICHDGSSGDYYSNFPDPAFQDSFTYTPEE